MRFSFNQALYVIGAAFGLGAVGYGGYMAWNALNSLRAVEVAPPAGCDLHREPCRAMLPGGGELRLAISPRPIPLGEPIMLEVELLGRNAESVAADIGSPDAFIWYSRHTLSPEDDNRYIGKTALAFCTRETMRWHVIVVARVGRDIYRVPFDFETLNRAARTT